MSEQQGKDEGVFSIVYDGLQASMGVMPVDDFITSLVGWHDFVQLGTSVYLQKKLTLTPLPPDQKPGIQIRAIQTHSVAVWLAIGVVSGLAVKWAPTRDEIWKWIQRLFKQHLSEKKQIHTLDEVVRSLERLATENRIDSPENEAECFDLVKEIDTALKRATEPIEESVADITVKMDRIRISVNSEDKRHLHSGFSFTAKDEQFFRASVLITELNLSTGHSYVIVEKAANPEFGNKKACYIKDERELGTARNAYTQAFNERRPIEVWVKPVHDRDTGLVKQWQVQLELPKITGGLLDLLKGGNSE